ncbi:MAG: MerR family transcriptional regulator [Gaiellaceae bacterium]
MDGAHVSEAAARTGWSPRMLRYLERAGLVVPARTAAGYRRYGLRELNQLRSLTELRRRFDVDIVEVAFAARLRREPELRRAVDGWLAGADDLVPKRERSGASIGHFRRTRGRSPRVLKAGTASGALGWVEWEQRKHEKLLAA